MKHIIFFIVFVCFPMLATAQSEATKPYIYNILTFSGSLKKESYWIIRRPCTQEEFDKTVEEGIRK